MRFAAMCLRSGFSRSGSGVAEDETAGLRGGGAFPFAPGGGELVGFVFREAATLFGREAERRQTPVEVHSPEAAFIAHFNGDPGGEVGTVVEMEAADVERLTVKTHKMSSRIGAMTGHAARVASASHEFHPASYHPAPGDGPKRTASDG